MSSVHFDIMNQLQSALLGATGGRINLEEIERLRMSFPMASNGATHSNRIRTILSSLPPSNSSETDPMILYSAFTELWELIVLTGEEVETYEFDTVIDLKPLLGHLLRVLAWKDDCKIYGEEFLLYAIRCTCACVQYSPGCARRLVESGLVPLITTQLFSVEYIDMAEDSILILKLLTKNGVHSKICLHSDGIKAVLGFVDFLALSVQINAFNAAAQMATALTDETLDLYLSADILALIRGVIKKSETETDAQNIKLIHEATQILQNALKVAPSHSETLFPTDFVNEIIISHLSGALPMDAASVILRLAGTKRSLKIPSEILLKFIKSLLNQSKANESLLEETLKIIMEIYCHSADKILKDILSFMKTRTRITGVSEICDISTDSVSEALFEFYLNAPSLSVSLRQLTLFTIFLLDSVSLGMNSNYGVSLEKMAVLSKLLADVKDPFSLVIGLEWFRILLNGSKEIFLQMATRQGLPSELETLKSFQQNGSQSEELKKWLENRMDSLNKTIFSGNEPVVYEIYIKHLVNELLNELNSSTNQKTLNISFNSLEEFFELSESSNSTIFTEYEWLGDLETCLAKRLLDLLETSNININLVETSKFKPICESIYRALNRYDDNFFVANVPTTGHRINTQIDPFSALSVFDRPMRVVMRVPGFPDRVTICDPTTQIGWLVKVIASSTEEELKMIMLYYGMGVNGAQNDYESVSNATDAISGKN